MYYGKQGYIEAIEHQKEQLLHVLLEAAFAMKNIAGCIIYSVGLDHDQSNKIYIYEVWKDELSHQSSLSNPVFINLIQQARPLIKSMESYPTLTIYGGKGII